MSLTLDDLKDVVGQILDLECFHHSEDLVTSYNILSKNQYGFMIFNLLDEVQYKKISYFWKNILPQSIIDLFPYHTKLIESPYFLIIHQDGKNLKIFWRAQKDNLYRMEVNPYYDRAPNISFEEVLERVSPNIQERLIFALDLFKHSN